MEDALTEQGPDKEIPLVRTSIHGALPQRHQPGRSHTPLSRHVTLLPEHLQQVIMQCVLISVMIQKSKYQYRNWTALLLQPLLYTCSCFQNKDVPSSGPKSMAEWSQCTRTQGKEKKNCIHVHNNFIQLPISPTDDDDMRFPHRPRNCASSMLHDTNTLGSVDGGESVAIGSARYCERMCSTH